MRGAACSKAWASSTLPQNRRAEQGDTDASITSPALTDAGLRLLKNPANTSGRFFMWIHYFDPHAQSLALEDSPVFHRFPADPNHAPHTTPKFGSPTNISDDCSTSFAHPTSRKKPRSSSRPDHGEAFNDHGMSWHGGELWESLVHVPLVFYVPGIKPHRVPVKRSHIDVVPTLIDILRLPQPPSGELSGVSMIGDLLSDEPIDAGADADGGAAYPERDVYLDMPVGPYTQMRRGVIHGPTPGLKLIHFGGNLYNLFDLAADPAEATDIAGDKRVLTLFFGISDDSRRPSRSRRDARPNRVALSFERPLLPTARDLVELRRLAKWPPKKTPPTTASARF